jgi:hypothetical protein
VEVNLQFARLMKMSAAATVAVLVTGAAIAQQGPPRGDRGWGMWGNGPGWGTHMGMWRRWDGGANWMLERVEGRLAFMKAELKITEAQLPAWNQLAEAVRAAARQHNERMKVIFDNDRFKTLPERVAAQELFMSARLDGIRQIKSSLEGLYAVLSTDQKKEADEMVIPMVGMGGPWS